MLSKKPIKAKDQEDFFGLLLDKFLPFWPYLILLGLLFGGMAFVYLKFATPTYDVSAKLIIKDEGKGVDGSELMESMNPFDSKKIVENEIQVIQSKEIVYGAVDSLMLYAPITEDKAFKPISAYNTSPIKIKVENPDRISIPLEEYTKHYFSFYEASNSVRMNDEIYALDIPHDLPFGTITFIRNDKQNGENEYPLYFELINPAILTDYISGSLTVVPTDKLSTVVILTYVDQLRSRGEDILNAVIASYINKGFEERKRLAESTLAFIEDRIVNVELELNNLEDEIEQYTAEAGAINLSEQGRIFLQDAGANNRNIADLNLQITLLGRVKSYVISKSNQGGIVPSTTGINNPVLTQLLQKLYNSEIEYASLSKTTAENNPLLLSLADEIANIRPSILENINNQQASLKASLRSLNSNSGRFNTVLKGIPEKERALLEIKRSEDIKKELFSFLLQKREETALAHAPTEGDTKVIEKASASVYPSSPKGIKIYGMACFAALGLWIAYVVITEMMNKKILFRSEIEDFIDLPVLGELSFSKKTKKNTIFTPKDVVLTEQLRHLNARLGLYHRTFTKKKIIITSNIAGEGKSFVSRNLAINIAQSGKRVALLDMDFRKPQLSKVFQMIDKKGTVNYLKGDCGLPEIVNQLEAEENLFVIPAGTKGGDHTKELLNGKLETLFAELSESFDVVIVDSAPMGLVSDVNLLAEYCDLKLLVIRHGFTPKKIVQRLEQIEQIELLDNMGVVFNGIKKRGFTKKDSGYGYGYSQAYGY